VLECVPRIRLLCRADPRPAKRVDGQQPHQPEEGRVERQQADGPKRRVARRRRRRCAAGRDAAPQPRLLEVLEPLEGVLVALHRQVWEDGRVEVRLEPFAQRVQARRPARRLLLLGRHRVDGRLHHLRTRCLVVDRAERRGELGVGARAEQQLVREERAHRRRLVRLARRRQRVRHQLQEQPQRGAEHVAALLGVGAPRGDAAAPPRRDALRSGGQRAEGVPE